MKKIIIIFCCMFILSYLCSNCTPELNHNEHIDTVKMLSDSIKIDNLLINRNIVLDHNIYEETLKVSKATIHFLEHRISNLIILFGGIISLLSLLFLVFSLFNAINYNKFNKKKDELLKIIDKSEIAIDKSEIARKDLSTTIDTGKELKRYIEGELLFNDK